MPTHTGACRTYLMAGQEVHKILLAWLQQHGQVAPVDDLQA